MSPALNQSPPSPVASPASRITDPRGHTPLRGRESELEQLLEATSRRPSLVVVDGVAGIGASRLLTELATVLGRVGVSVGTLDDRRLALGPAAWGQHQSGGVLLLDSPLVASAELLDEILADVRNGVHAWVIASRHRTPASGGADRHMRAALMAAATRRLTLAPIDDRAARALVGDRLGSVTGDGERALAIARGLPGLLWDLLSAVIDGDAPAEAVVQRRMAQLPRRTRIALQAAAMLRPSFVTAELAALAALDGQALSEALAHGRDAGLLISEGPVWRFRHDDLRLSVRATVPSAMGPLLHRQAIDTMLTHGADAAEVGPMLAAVAQPGDIAALRTLRQAVDLLALRDPVTAATLGRRALELSTGEEDPAFISQVVGLLWQTHPLAEIRTLSERLGSDTVPGAADGAREAVSGWLTHDHDEDTTDDAAPEGRANGSAVAESVGTTALRLAFRGPADRADRAIDVALATAAVTGDDRIRSGALTARSVRRAASDVTGARADIDLALALVSARREPTPDILFTRFWHVAMLGVEDRLNDCLIAADDQVARLQRSGHLGATRTWRSLRATALLGLGRLAEARTSAEAVLAQDAADDPDRAPLAARQWHLLLRVGLHTSDRQLTERAVERAVSMSNGPSARTRRIAQWMLAVTCDHQRRPEDARVAVAEIIAATLSQEPTMLLAQSPTDQVRLGRMALAVGEDIAARALCDALAERARRAPQVATLTAAAGHLKALIADAADGLADVARIYGEAGRVLDRAWALEDLAHRTQSGTGGPAQALTQALDIYERAGASGDAGRVRAALRDLGVIRRPLSRQIDPASGLTAREHAVAQAVITGATDRQIAEQMFISPHTVRTHIRHIFQKLDVSSRVELVGRIGETR